MSSTHDADTKNTRTLGIGATIAITILVTLVLTLLSMTLGGFGSQEAKASETRGFSVPIILHLATALPALILGPIVLLRRKGDRTHRMMGRIWVGLMLVTAVASAFIRSPGAGFMGTGFSFIHIFTVWTLVNAPLGVWMARKGNTAAHKGIMTGLYIGLVIAGATTLIPGRMFGTMLFM